MALFDVRAGKKISEDFHFDINHDSMTQLINCENSNDINGYVEVAKNCKVTKNWLFKQKQVNLMHFFFFLTIMIIIYKYLR